MLHLLGVRECTHHRLPCLNLPGAFLNSEIEIEIKLWKRRFVLEFSKGVMEGIWIGAAHFGCITVLCHQNDIAYLPSCKFVGWFVRMFVNLFIYLCARLVCLVNFLRLLLHATPDPFYRSVFFFFIPCFPDGHFEYPSCTPTSTIRISESVPNPPKKRP